VDTIGRSEILVALLDDDPLMRELASGVVRRCGFKPECHAQASDLEEALDERLPDVILLDLAIGDEDGLAVLDMLARRRCKAPVIMMSGCGERVLSSARRFGRSLGLTMLDPLAKPIAPQHLAEALQRAVRTAAPIRQDDLAAALERVEFTPYYQPKVSLAEGRPVGVEALVRWEHPERGLLQPSAFVPLIESGDHVSTLTVFMIERALADRRRWALAGHDLTVAVNVGARSLVERGFPERVAETVRIAGAKPADLILEITETSAMSDAPSTIAALTRLRIHGFSLSMDDFGTGYSSLRELHRMPFSELKVDRSFVTEMETDADARVIVGAIIGLGRSLGLQTVAEGIESEGAVSTLGEMGCTAAQGFLFGRPMPADRIADWLSSPRQARE
jgi:EAL domain-containing protein (putative c-di-GMP-specific phosphodiesterase class I)